MGFDGLVVDAVIILVYFVVITAIGLYMGRRENSLHDFALGGRRVPWWAVMASIIAAETSAATFLGAPGEGYDKRSLAYVQLVLGLIIGRVHRRLRLPQALLHLQGLHRLRLPRHSLRAVDQELRLGALPVHADARLGHAAVRSVAGDGAGLAAVRRRAASVQFSQQAVTTVGPYLVAIILLTILTCLYTAVGGIKAVIWTDVIQAA